VIEDKNKFLNILIIQIRIIFWRRKQIKS